MEERKEQTHEEEQTQEEKSFIDMKVIEEEIKRVQTEEGERTAEEERHKSEDVIVKNKVLKAERIGEGQMDSAKKQRQICTRKNPKAKPTVPQPFSLATEKRMSKERRGSVDFVSATDQKRMARDTRGSMDFKNLSSQSKLSRPVSLNHRIQYSSPNAGLKTKDKIQPLQPNGEKQEKQQGYEKKENAKLQKSSGFKALPLPGFYHRKDSSSNSEIKRINLVTQPKSPVVGRQSKPASKAESIKTGDKAKGLSSKTITSSAKEKINKIFRSTRKVLDTSKGTVKGVNVVSVGDKAPSPYSDTIVGI